MGNFIDLTGKKFGRLVVIERKENTKHGSSQWLCRCDCGNETVVDSQNLRGNKTLSCGCLQKEKAMYSNTTHGMFGTKIYRAWCHAKERCYNPNVKNYKDYGGRGIKMCDEWKNNPDKFIEWSLKNGFDINSFGDDCTIDRIDVNGDYCPENCRWVSKQEQANNTRTNHYLTYNGETKTLAQWSRELGIKYHIIVHRVNKWNWGIKELVENET